MTAKQTPLRAFFRNTWVRVFATLALFVVLVLVALPYAASYALHNWLLDNGGEAVRIEDVDFNPFTGKASLTQLHVMADTQPRLTIPRLELDIDWLPLYSKQVYLKAVSIDGVNLTIDVATDGSLTIGGIALGSGTEDSSAGQAWHYGVEQLQVMNSVIDYRSPQLKLKAKLDDVQLGGLKTWATEPAPLTVQGAINGAAIRLSGELPPLSAGFGYSGQLNVAALPLGTFAGIVQPALTELDGTLTVDNDLKLLQAPGGALQFSQNGLLQTDGLRLHREGEQLVMSRLQWQGTTELTLPAAGSLQSEFRGRLTGAGLAVDIPAQDLALRQDEFHWEGTVAATGGEAPGMQTTSSLAGTGLALDMPAQGLALRQDNFHWEGAVAVTGGEAPGVQTTSSLAGTGLALDMPAQGLALQQGDFHWQGEVAVTGGEAPGVQTTGSLSMKNVSADASDSNLRLASLDALEAGTVAVNPAGDLVIDGLALNGLVFARENVAADSDSAKTDASMLAAAAVTVDHLQLSGGSRLAIGNMEWRDTTSYVQREPDGQWRPVRIIDTLPFTGKEDGEEAAAVSADGAAASVRVDTLRVTGQSAIIVNDTSVKPVFNMRLQITEAVLQNIDTALPGQDSPITLKGRFDKHSRFAINGTLRPFAERPTVQLKSFIEGLALTPLSSYTSTSMGYALKSGHLDAESDIRINKGQMKVENDLTIRGLEIGHLHNASRAELDKQLALPLDVALNMLRDKHNTIHVQLPVNGDINSPDFNISDALNQAIGSAMKQGSVAYLTMALQPYGALITVARLAGDAATRVRLDPVVFEPGAVANREERLDYLKKVAGILQQRPNVNLKVCGIAVAEDRRVLAGLPAGSPAAKDETAAGKDPGGTGKGAIQDVTDEQLLQLAAQRAAAVKDYLVTEHGVTASHLVACQARIDDADAAGEPRVELLI